MNRVQFLGAATLAVAVLVSGGCSGDRDEPAKQAVTRLDVEASSTFRGDVLAEFELVDQLGRKVTHDDCVPIPRRDLLQELIRLVLSRRIRPWHANDDLLWRRERLKEEAWRRGMTRIMKIRLM